MNITNLHKQIEELTATETGQPVKLEQWDPSEAGDFTKQDAAPLSAENVQALDELAYRLYAENARSLLIVLQEMDPKFPPAEPGLENLKLI